MKTNFGRNCSRIESSGSSFLKLKVILLLYLKLEMQILLENRKYL